jgi:hypothetical protein
MREINQSETNVFFYIIHSVVFLEHKYSETNVTGTIITFKISCFTSNLLVLKTDVDKPTFCVLGWCKMSGMCVWIVHGMGKKLQLSKLHIRVCPYFLGSANIICAQRSPLEFAGLIKLHNYWTILVALLSVRVQTLETSVGSVAVCLAVHTQYTSFVSRV